MFALRTTIEAVGLAVGGLTMAVLAFLSAGGYGVRIYRALWPEKRTALEEMVFSAALGFGCISLLMVLAGVVNAWTRLGAWTILSVGLFLSRPFLRLLRRLPPAMPLQPGYPELLLTLCAVWAFLLALAPITYYDSLVYHFAMPAAYTRVHHWLGLKVLIYSAFPQNLEMLWTFGLLLANQTVANLISLTLAFLTVAATFSFAQRFFTFQTGRVAVMLLAAMPAFLLLSSGGYVDIGLTLYVFLSFYALCVGMETERSGILALSGVLAGIAVGIKYTGAIPCAVCGLLLLWHDRHRLEHAWRHILLFGGSTLVVVSPWLVKNTIYVGNPVFPFFYGWGNAKLNPWIQNAAAGYFHGLAEYEPRSLIELLRLPWDIIVSSLRFGGGMDVLGDYGWAPLILLSLAGILRRKNSAKLGRLQAYALLFILPWALTRPVLRFLLPLAPVLALLSAVAWTESIAPLAPPFRWTCGGVVAVLLLMGFGEFFVITSVIGQFPVALGLVDRDAYLARKLNYYSAARFVNQLPDVSEVFVLGDQRGYYYNKRVMVSSAFSENPFVTWANQAASPEAFADGIKAQGFRHIVVNFVEMRRLANYRVFDFSQKGEKNWKAFESRLTRRLYQDNACEVLEIP